MILLERAIITGKSGTVGIKNYSYNDFFLHLEQRNTGSLSYAGMSTNYFRFNLINNHKLFIDWHEHFMPIFYEWHKTGCLSFYETDFCESELQRIYLSVKKFGDNWWDMDVYGQNKVQAVIIYQFSCLIAEYDSMKVRGRVYGKKNPAPKKFRECALCGRLFLPSSVRQRYCKNWGHY